MRILKTADIIPNEIIQHDGIEIFNYVSGKQIKELCEAVVNEICHGNTYAIKMSKEERENLPFLNGMKVSREIHIDPLVTCGECKHWNEETHGCNRNPSVNAWWETDYCSYGERK